MMTESERLSRIMTEMARGKERGRVLNFCPKTKTIKPERFNYRTFQYAPDPDDPISVDREDGHLSGEDGQANGQIALSGDFLESLRQEKELYVFFKGIEKERVYSLLTTRQSNQIFPGTILETEDTTQAIENFGQPEDKIRVMIKKIPEWSDYSIREESSQSRGYVKIGDKWENLPLQIVPTKNELYSRLSGLLETDILAEKRVAVFGLGSVGSLIAVELAKSGVSKFDLIDFDRIEVGNVVRHHCGISDVGRLKVDAMFDAVLEKNPFADIRVWPLRVDWEQYEVVEEIVGKADLVIIATDNQRSRLVINKAGVKAGKVCIAGGAYRRAYGGQVLRIRPGQSCCYQCFMMLLPERAEDQGVSKEEQAVGIAYTDRVVPIEPGLSTDIAPISLFMVKMAIQELLKDRPTSLRSLDDDLSASWYCWLNRREIGTQFENLEPLENNIDGMHVLRWYGVGMERHPGCPVCGDFTDNFSDKCIIDSLEALKNIPKS